MKKFTLVGQDGNAFAVMGYTAQALKRAGMGDIVDQMREEATSGGYSNLLVVCEDYLDMANAKLGLTDDEEEDLD